MSEDKKVLNDEELENANGGVVLREPATLLITQGTVLETNQLPATLGVETPSGEAARILIRGASSITANNDPLIVIDGLPD